MVSNIDSTSHEQSDENPKHLHDRSLMHHDHGVTSHKLSSHVDASPSDNSAHASGDSFSSSSLGHPTSPLNEDHLSSVMTSHSLAADNGGNENGPDGFLGGDIAQGIDGDPGNYAGIGGVVSPAECTEDDPSGTGITSVNEDLAVGNMGAAALEVSMLANNVAASEQEPSYSQVDQGYEDIGLAGVYGILAAGATGLGIAAYEDGELSEAIRSWADAVDYAQKAEEYGTTPAAIEALNAIGTSIGLNVRDSALYGGDVVKAPPSTPAAATQTAVSSATAPITPPASNSALVAAAASTPAATTAQASAPNAVTVAASTPASTASQASVPATVAAAASTPATTASQASAPDTVPAAASTPTTTAVEATMLEKLATATVTTTQASGSGSKNVSATTVSGANLSSAVGSGASADTISAAQSSSGAIGTTTHTVESAFMTSGSTVASGSAGVGSLVHKGGQSSSAAVSAALGNSTLSGAATSDTAAFGGAQVTQAVTEASQGTWAIDTLYAMASPIYTATGIPLSSPSTKDTLPLNVSFHSINSSEDHDDGSKIVVFDTHSYSS